MRSRISVIFVLAMSQLFSYNCSSSDSMPKPLNDTKFEDIIITDHKNLWNEIRILTYDQATILAKLERDALILNALEIITVEQAEILSTFQGNVLKLNRLGLSDDSLGHILSALTSFKGGKLYLNGLKKINVRQATALGKFMDFHPWGNVIQLKNRDIFSKLDNFDKEFLRELYPEYKTFILSLEGISSLGEKELEKLIKFIGNELWLGGLKNLNVTKARALKLFSGSILRLDGVRSIEEDIAKVLSEFDGYISMKGLNENGKALAAKHFKLKHPNQLSDADFALRLISIPLVMKRLTDKQARILSKLKRDVLYLDDLEFLTDRQTSIIASFRGEGIYLNGINFLTDYQAIALSTFAGKGLKLNGLKSLTRIQAENLSKFEGRMLTLYGVTSITEEIARSLSTFDGGLFLKNLDSSSIELLKKYRGDRDGVP